MGLKFWDIIKGLLFVAALIVLYYFIPLIYGIILIPIFGLLKNNPLIFILLFALFIIGWSLISAFSKAVEAGFNLQTLFNSRKDASHKKKESD